MPTLGMVRSQLSGFLSRVLCLLELAIWEEAQEKKPRTWKKH